MSMAEKRKNGGFDRRAIAQLEKKRNRKNVPESAYVTQMRDPNNLVEFDGLCIDLDRYELRIGGAVVEAPPKEMELLHFLAAHPNRVYTRNQLLDEVWGFDYYGDSRTIDVHVKRLREKLEGVSEKWSLKTVWGVGYKFEAL
jgi:DNA-binding response OmpR family regulator